MTSTSFRVDTPRSYALIEKAARHVRDVVRLDARDPHSLAQLFERLDELCVLVNGRNIVLDYAIEELPSSSAGAVEAQAYYDDRCDRLVVALSQDTYDQLQRDVPRARFTVGHEIGHAALHSAELTRWVRVPDSRTALSRINGRELRSYLSTEWQANAFSAALLMPASALLDLEKRGRLLLEDVMCEFCVSGEAARIRLNVYNRRRQQLLMNGG